MKNNKELTEIKHTPIESEAEALIARAIDKNVPVESLERLLAMRRELKAEKAEEEYNNAMSAFQSDCPIIKKTKQVKTKTGMVAYRFAPIESIVEQVKQYIFKHGFSYTSNMELLENGQTKVKATLTVTHKRGHKATTEMTVPLGTKTDIMSQTQVVAAAQTFAKRYAFCNAFGILTGDEDVDAAPQQNQDSDDTGRGASGTSSMGKAMMASQKQMAKIMIELDRTGYSDEDLKKKYNIESKKQLTIKQASGIIENLLKLPTKAQEKGGKDEK